MKPVVRTRDGFSPTGIRRSRSRWPAELRWFVICLVVAVLFLVVALALAR